MISIALLGLLMAGVCSCGQVEVAEVTETTTEADVIALSENPWGVTIEQIDLDDPANQKYIDWAKECPTSNTFESPEYFSEWTHEMRTDKEPSSWTYVWANKKKNMPREKYRSWNETKELVVRFIHKNESDGDKELLIRDKATGKTVQIAKGGFDTLYDIRIISDTRFLYDVSYWDGSGAEQSLVYDLETGDSICYRSIVWDKLCDLGNEQYLWSDRNRDAESGLYLIDASALATGNKNAKHTVFSWGSDYSGGIQYLSSDGRFVYVELYQFSDDTRNRGVYDVETGEQVALFELPLAFTSVAYDYVLISDDLEYVYYSAGPVNDPVIHYFFIIHYDRTGGKQR